MKTYTMKVATKFSDEEESRMIENFLKKQRETGISIEAYASLIGIPRYTFRDWYRDPRYNPEWEDKHPNLKDIARFSDRREDAIRRYLELTKTREISLHEFAGIIGIPYYTLRSWWRDYTREKEEKSSKKMHSSKPHASNPSAEV